MKKKLLIKLIKFLLTLGDKSSNPIDADKWMKANPDKAPFIIIVEGVYY